MSEFPADHQSGDTACAPAESIFAWRGPEIVLLGVREGDRFVLARGWLRADRFADIRRWSFSDPVRFAVQVRRLVAESGIASDLAAAAATHARAWAELVA